ncbi:hypothetical protein CCAX7_37210 [Capsulimonas corticalis]|uniref:PEP-CTERM protein-sorting domain-containing protein n=1 Tax=Capsulimonas corticalis TaxID=2219043 RepID=A0A402D159_9BACT|nr:PEP-CTERM sorting domain-containing protein [Capsulimonas corticalis]BDI31670.1 hypothetical protein CCAX7_37210 [Capsulimonas corticalis]
MKSKKSWIAAGRFATISTGMLGVFSAAHAQPFVPGDLVVSRSVYMGSASTVVVGQNLPGGGQAIANGSYPNVFANESVDSSFGVTSPIFLDEIKTNGALDKVIAVPDSLLTTSFPSKSELALNLSQDHHSLTFMGYASPINHLDVSNSNTPNHFDPTNPVGTTVQRVIAQYNANGSVSATNVNSYSGNNGRAAIYANGNYYTVGNAGNGSGSPSQIVDNTGVQISKPGQSETTMVGNYSVTQNGYKADKPGKDNNFRGETIFNNTLYVTKGSGSNGIDTVYQVGNAGSLPTISNAANTPITIVTGFPTGLAKTNTAKFAPFGLFFANSDTLYVADEGDGTGTDANAGLEKWSKVNGVWHLDYTLQNGLNLGVQYSVNGLPTTLDPATTGLRNITGRVNSDGTVSIYAVTSTASGATDQGADPNKLVSITDQLNYTTSAQSLSEQFSILKSASYGEVLRGVAFAPTVPEPSSIAALLMGVAGLGFGVLKRRRSQV